MLKILKIRFAILMIIRVKNKQLNKAKKYKNIQKHKEVRNIKQIQIYKIKKIQRLIKKLIKT